MAGLFRAEPGRQWVFCNVYGSVTLVKDPRSGHLSLAMLYHEPWQVAGRAVLLWQHYLYYGFDKHYRALSSTFHSFPAPEGGHWGLSFADARQAKELMAALQRRSARALRPQPKNAPSSSGILGFFGLGKSASAETASRRQPGKRLTVHDMSDPRDFQHLVHIGFNPMTGTFEPHNVPPEWIELFEKAGLSGRDLEDKGTAKVVASFVNDNLTAVQSAVARAPPAGAQAAPPPPPVPQPAEGPKASESAPQVTPERANLLDSIRKSSVSALKKVPLQEDQQQQKPVAAPGQGTDLMASMLAKALAERKQKVAGTRVILAIA